MNVREGKQSSEGCGSGGEKNRMEIFFKRWQGWVIFLQLYDQSSKYLFLKHLFYGSFDTALLHEIQLSFTNFTIGQLSLRVDKIYCSTEWA
jgi:hypothetical protein